MEIKIKYITLVLAMFISMLVLNSCSWEPETFTYDDLGLYTTVERIDSDHFRIYFHDTRENRKLDYIEIFYSISTEQSPAMNINFYKDNPYVLAIKDYGECVEKVKTSLYDLTVSRLIKKNKDEIDSYDYSDADNGEYFEPYYKWSDSTIINKEFITYSFDPAFFNVAVYKNGRNFMGMAYKVR